MGTECQKDYCEEDKQLLDEAEEAARREQEQGLDEQLLAEYAKEMPAIEAANENRAVELLRGNIEAGLNSLPEDFFRSSGENTILKLDAEAIPTDQECRENYRIGREIRMERYEIANFPVIMGIKDPETLERMPGIKDAIKDEMGRLYHSKLSPWFRDAEVVDRIILVDKNAGDIKGATAKQKELIADKSLPRVVHVFRNSKTGKMQKGKELHWTVIHELVHLNLNKGRDSSGEKDFRGIFHDQHREEWINTCLTQVDSMKHVSGYARDIYDDEGMAGLDETVFVNSEYIAECVAAWDTNPEKVCPEMQAFLDKYLS